MYVTAYGRSRVCIINVISNLQLSNRRLQFNRWLKLIPYYKQHFRSKLTIQFAFVSCSYLAFVVFCCFFYFLIVIKMSSCYLTAAIKNKRITYSDAYCHRLVDIICCFSNIIECKKTDAVTWKEKVKQYKKIIMLHNPINMCTNNCSCICYTECCIGKIAHK